MDVETKIGLHAVAPLIFLTEHLQRGVRLDGRSLLSSRQIVTKRGVLCNCPSASVKIGNTMVICSIKFLIGVPNTHHPNKGDVLFDMNVLNLRIENRNKTSTELEVASTLQKLVER
jgi:exosome complex RNA-binding protein Rrp42 (RNase PH superfamily)